MKGFARADGSAVATTHLSEADTDNRAERSPPYRCRVVLLGFACVGLAASASLVPAVGEGAQRHVPLASYLTEKAWDAASDGKETTAIRYALAAARMAPRDVSLQPLLARLAFALPIDDGWKLHSVKNADLASFSTDGSQLLTVSVDDSASQSIARLWEIASGRLLRQQIIEGAVEDASLSPDGRLLLTTIHGDHARIFELESQRELMHFGPSVRRAMFFPNGQRIITVSKEGKAELWDSATGNKLKELWHDDRPIEEAILSPDGLHVLTISNDGAASLYDVNRAPRPMYLVGSVDYSSFSRDGTRVVTESDFGGSYRVWDVATGHEVNHFLSDIPAELTSDGKRVLTSSNRSVSITEVSTGSVIAEVACDDAVISAKMSPDDKRVLVAYGNATNNHQSLAVWELAGGPILRSLESDDGERFDIQFSPDGRQIVTRSMDRVVRIWGTRGSRLLAQLPSGENVKNSRFSADSRELLTIASDDPNGLQPATVRLWNVGSGEMVGELAQKVRVLDVNVLSDRMQIITASPDDTLQLYDGFPGPITAEVSAPGVYFAEILGDGVHVRTSGNLQDQIWDRIWDTVQNTLKPAIGPLSGKQFYSRDGSRVAAWDSTSVKIQDLRHGGVIKLQTDQPAGDDHVTFFSDGRVLTSSYGIMQMWNGKGGREIWRYDVRGTIFITELSDDERLIITVIDRNLADEAIVGIFDSANGRELTEIRCAQMPSVISISHDGSKVLLALRDDANALIYDSMTGRELARMTATGVVTTAAFSPDGQRLIVGSQDGISAIWDLSVLVETPARLIERLCRFPGVIPAEFSDTELWADQLLRSSEAARGARASLCADAGKLESR